MTDLATSSEFLAIIWPYSRIVLNFLQTSTRGYDLRLSESGIGVSTCILLSENRITFYFKVTTEKEGQDPKCYKTTAGILVPQTLAGVKEIINKRGQALVGEMQQ